MWRNHSVRSPTSLPLLLEVLEPRATLVLVCDTVACSNDLGGRCGYVDLVEAVKRKYEDFINTVLSNARLGKHRGSVDVAVIPCFGTFKNGEFLTRANDTRIRILHELLEFLVRNIINVREEKGSEEVIVTLDLTHGVNYLPTLTYVSLKTLLRHLAFIGRGAWREIRVQVLDSDPFVRGVTNTLNVNIIEETTIHPSTEPYPINGDVALKFTQCRHGEESSCTDVRTLRELGKSYRWVQEHLSNLLDFYASVHAGTPLATLTFMNRLDLEELMDGVRKYFEDHIREGFKVSVSSGKVRVVETLCLTRQAEFILKAIALLAAVRESVGKREAGTEPTLRNLSTVAEIIAWNQTVKEMTANELHNIKKIICEYLLSPSKEAVGKLTKNELASIIEKCVEALSRLEKGTDLKEVVTVTGKTVGGFSSRNFLAHAGLEYNTIRVEATIKLTYKEEYVNECRKTLRNQVRLSRQSHA